MQLLNFKRISTAFRCFLRFFGLYASHLLAVTQLLAKVIQAIQAAEIQRQGATLARLPHPNGGVSLEAKSWAASVVREPEDDSAGL